MARLKTFGADVLALHAEKQQAIIDMAQNIKQLGRKPKATVDTEPKEAKSAGKTKSTESK